MSFQLFKPCVAAAMAVVASFAPALATGQTESTPAPASASSPTEQQLTSEAWIAEGRTKFVQTCAYCHGAEGDSGKNRPFRERTDWNHQTIHNVISNGRQRGANVMPAWKGSIPDEEIWRIAAYIKSLGGKPRSP